jgi:fatty acid desaturase
MTLDASPKKYVSRSNARGLAALVLDWSAILVLAATGIYFDHWVLSFLLAWPIGLFQFSIGEVLAHEASHYNLFASRKWNNWGEWFYTIPFLYGLHAYRKQHLLHHSKLGVSELDHLVRDYEELGLLKQSPNLFWIFFGRPLMGVSGVFYLRMVAYELLDKSAGLKIVGFWTLITGACLATDTLKWLLWFWFLPLLWTYSSFLCWSEIREHFNAKSGTRTDVSWLNYLTHNNGYHTVHHSYPTIPWYRLRQAHHGLCNDQDLDICNGLWGAYKAL